jgi:hypothetical protein
MFRVMSKLLEIQDAISELPSTERKALYLWMQSQREFVVSAEEESKLLTSLDKAIRDLDTGKGVSVDRARKLVSSWAGK